VGKSLFSETERVLSVLEYVNDNVSSLSLGIDIQKYLQYMAVLLFYAELDRALREETLGFKQIKKEHLLKAKRAIFGKISYDHIKDIFDYPFWRDTEASIEKELKEILHEPTFHITQIDMDSIIEARHEIAHEGVTNYAIMPNNISNCVRFIELLLSAITK